MKRLIVGITGATGAIFGIRVLEALKDSGVETHLVLSKWGIQTIEHETAYTAKQVRDLACVNHVEGNMGASISSGSFLTEGMVIAPCSMRTLAAIAHGTGDHLVHRAADVILKERRKLVLVTREMPLSDLHLENMLKLSRMGVTIMPPMPAFYNHPETLDDMVNHIVARILDQFSIPVDFAQRWSGEMGKPSSVKMLNNGNARPEGTSTSHCTADVLAHIR
ncbi:UbiX family flavin prenyltransferase [Noviherbaspirillum sp.]|uniref:UbiX family flavin prenyltransferase n=1 Tax=Noviherbaspirillum sp. TaxID=1926288 RepID=UPI002B46477B|nr:UbiX family flavin prenyltransferase [Noviherbaspirillum sp.]HJV81995.1 UbiX family flavin prenyltransferase [Noviherbaspirillum sp.]